MGGREGEDSARLTPGAASAGLRVTGQAPSARAPQTRKPQATAFFLLLQVVLAACATGGGGAPGHRVWLGGVWGPPKAPLRQARSSPRGGDRQPAADRRLRRIPRCNSPPAPFDHRSAATARARQLPTPRLPQASAAALPARTKPPPPPGVGVRAIEEIKQKNREDYSRLVTLGNLNDSSGLQFEADRI